MDVYVYEGIDWFYVSLLTLCIWGVCFGLMVGFIYWALNTGTANYVTIVFTIWCFFHTIVLVLIYFGGKVRKSTEKQMIKDRLK